MYYKILKESKARKIAQFFELKMLQNERYVSAEENCVNGSKNCSRRKPKMSHKLSKLIECGKMYSFTAVVQT